MPRRRSRLLLPLAAKQAVEERVLDLAANVPAFAQVAFLLESAPLERSDRRFVARVDIGLETVHPERLERIVDERLERFAHEPMSPMVAPERIANLRMPVVDVDPDERARSDDAVVIGVELQYRITSGFEKIAKSAGTSAAVIHRSTTRPARMVGRWVSPSDA